MLAGVINMDQVPPHHFGRLASEQRRGFKSICDLWSKKW